MGALKIAKGKPPIVKHAGQTLRAQLRQQSELWLTHALCLGGTTEFVSAARLTEKPWIELKGIRLVIKLASA